ncbi:MAG: lysozyme [Hyphomonadaceae bacterium]
MTRFSISAEGLAFIKAHEGFHAEPTPLQAGIWLVGHGHVRVGEPGAAVSEDEAHEMLRLDVAPYEQLVTEVAPADLTQGQCDALVSFAFSIGAEAFVHSAVARRVSSGEYVAAACAMDAWRKSDASGEAQVLDVLVRRRAAEKALFLGAAEAAPSAFVRAKLDHAAAILGSPTHFAPTPEVSAVEAAPVAAEKPADAAIIAAVLKAEPATEALLLTQALPPEEVEPVEEIVTAHARPVARTLQQARQAVQRSIEANKAAERAGRNDGLTRAFAGFFNMFRAPARA